MITLFHQVQYCLAWPLLEGASGSSKVVAQQHDLLPALTAEQPLLLDAVPFLQPNCILG